MQNSFPEPNRVVFISATLGVWGAEESLLALAAGLQNNGVRVHLVCFEGPLAERWFAAFPSETLTVVRSSGTHRKLTDTWKLLGSYRRISEARDAAVLFTYYLVIGAPLLKIGVRHPLALVLDMHDNLPGRRGQVLLRGFTRATRGVIAVSSFTANQFNDRSKVQVIHRAVNNIDAAHPIPDSWPLQAGVYRIGIIGRINWEKHHHIVFRAVSGLDETCTLIVRGSLDVGDPEASEGILEEGRALLGSRMIFEGQVPAIEAVAGLDMVIVANPREPMGRTVIEAQLTGAIAIVPSTGGSQELVNDLSTGLVYNSLDPDDLRRVIESIIENPELAQQVRSNAQIAARQHAKPEQYAAKYLGALGRFSNEIDGVLL